MNVMRYSLLVVLFFGVLAPDAHADSDLPVRRDGVFMTGAEAGELRNIEDQIKEVTRDYERLSRRYGPDHASVKQLEEKKLGLERALATRLAEIKQKRSSGDQDRGPSEPDAQTSGTIFPSPVIDLSYTFEIGEDSSLQEIEDAIKRIKSDIAKSDKNIAFVKQHPDDARSYYWLLQGEPNNKQLKETLAWLEEWRSYKTETPSKNKGGGMLIGLLLIVVGLLVLLAVYYFKFYKAPLKLPEGAKRFCPPGTPAWPLIYRLPNGSAIVIGKHPTISSLKMSDGLIGGGWLIGLLLMSCMCCSGIAQTEEENAEPSSQRAFITIALIAAAVAGTGTVLGLSIRNKTTRIDLDKEKLLINGKVWKRLPGVDIVFRIKPLDHINEKLDREKNKQMRMSLVNARQVQMIYGMQTVQIVVILSTPSSEQFAAVCSLADQLVVNLPASAASDLVEPNANSRPGSSSDEDDDLLE